MSKRPTLNETKRVIVKTGSALIADESGHPRTDWLGRLAADIADWRAEGREVILVTSGAIALGRNGLSQVKLKRLEEKQAAAALGQPRLMAALTSAFELHKIKPAQALLTLEDTENRRRWLNARATLETLLDAGALPVINENDTVATDEIRYGDNDRLAARVAQMVSADLLVLLSDIDGFYTSDPRKDSTAQHIPFIETLTPEIEAMAGGVNEARNIGSGGMATKLAAARIAQEAGCATVITLGNREAPLGALSQNARASWIIPGESPTNARQTWLRSHIQSDGTLTIDEGACKALQNGSSLLPVGVKEVSGQFDRGAIVTIQAKNGAAIAKGITSYSARDIARIAGYQSGEIEAILGKKARRSAIVHRNDLVLEDR